VQTFGDYLLWHPHLHIMATAGVFAPDGTFHLAPTGGWQQLGELWRMEEMIVADSRSHNRRPLFNPLGPHQIV